MGRPPSVDRAEIEGLYRSYGALVRRRARSILNDDREAEDALQEVFVRVIKSVADFRRQSQPSTWLYRITTNLCLNRVRDARRRRARLASVGDSAKAIPPTATGPAETAATVHNLLAQLPQDLAEIAVYYFVDEMDQAEIARLLGVSRRTIGYRLERFVEQARQLLAEAGVAPPGGLGVPKTEGESG